MSIEVLLDLIRQRFSASEGKTLIKSLQQDPLVWQFLQDEEKSLSFFKEMPNDVTNFTPGRMALWLIGKSQDETIGLLNTYDEALPPKTRQRAGKAFETLLNTGLPPADLQTAGLLALALRERRVLQGSWQGLADEIFTNRSKQAIKKNIQVWQTPFACLAPICPDFDKFTGEFTQDKNVANSATAIPVFIHAFLANPDADEQILARLVNFAKSLPIDLQLESINWLQVFDRDQLSQALAKNIIQTNKDVFAKTFSEIEALEAPSESTDPINKNIRYSLPEDINRLAAFYFYSGNKAKAVETYQKSSEILELIKSQTLYQSMAIDTNRVSQSQWLKIVQSVPTSHQARLSYVRALVNEQKFEEAARLLNEIPASQEKNLLSLRIALQNEAHSENKTSLVKSLALAENPIEDRIMTAPGYYVRNTQTGSLDETLATIKTLDDPELSLSYAESLLKTHPQNSNVIKLARDLYEKTHRISKATELASLLEIMEPAEISHKRSLASLLIIGERWQDAFSMLQEMIKSESQPAISDLEKFAEAALRTERVDMSISICQNILKQDAQNTKALILLGEGFMLKGDLVKAIQHMEQVVEMIPEEPETWLTLAHLWENSGQSDRAFEILNKGIVAVPNDPSLLREMGKAHLSRQAPADALIPLKKAHEIEPENFNGTLHLARAEHQLGQNDKAWGLIEPLLGKSEISAEISKLAGFVLLGLNQKQSAEPYLIQAAETSPKDLETVLAGTRLVLERAESPLSEVQEKELNRVQQILLNASQFHGNNIKINLHLADVIRLKGDYQKAFDSYRALSDLAPTLSPDYLWRLPYGLGKSAVALGNQEIGLAALQDAASKQPENLALMHALAEAYQVSDLDRKAQSTAKSALRLAPTEIDNILWYANFKTNNNEPEEAVKALKEALQINPDRSELKLWLSKSLISVGAIDESTRTLMELISNDSTNAADLHQAAYVCIHLNNLEIAAKAFEASRDRSKQASPMLVMDLAVLYNLLDQPKKALELINDDETLLSQHPELVLIKSDLLANLGQYEIASNILETNKEYAETSLEKIKDNESPTYQSPLLYSYDLSLNGYEYRLGQLHRVLGNIKSAQELLEKALGSQPNDLRLRKALVDAYLIEMNFNKALEVANSLPENLAVHNKFEVYQQEIMCSQAEVHLLRNQFDQANLLLDQFSPVDLVAPRYFALKSQVVFALGEDEVAESHLNESVNAYQEYLAKQQTGDPDVLFRRTMSLHNIAEAALTLQNYKTALDYNAKAWHLLKSQPMLNWRHAVTLNQAALKQQLAEALSITSHAPGKPVLAEKARQTSNTLIESLNEWLPKEKIMCLNAQATSAFTGQWPLHLSADDCALTSGDAQFVLFGADDEALAQRVIGSFPNEVEILQISAIRSLKHNNKQKGIAAAEKALTLNPANPINHALLAKLTADEPQRSIKSIDAALKFWPDEPEWHAFAADLLIKTGDYESAREHIAIALKNNPENANYWKIKADINTRTNDLDEAKEDLEKSAFYQANSPSTWVQMADVNRRIGNIDEAIKNIETASNLDPKDDHIATKHIQFLIEQNNFTEAEQKAETLLRSGGNHINATLLLAQAQAKQGKFEQAQNTLSSALKQHPERTDLKLENLRIRKDQDGVESVLPELINLAHDNPNDAETLTTLTDWLIQTNRLDKAAETAQTILRIVPDQPDVHLMLGRLQRMNGQLDQAIAHLSDAITLDPSQVDAYIELGKTYQDRRNLEEAIKIFQEGSKANASDPRPYYYAGMALKECKDYSAAEAMLKQAKKYAPEDANIIRQLGVITALNLINNLRETR